ncbi:MAG: hypothetical protein LUG21_05700 [Clostridiales bacterium]|nr:hypothetical protein [Clostridiales bacterium]
MFKKISLIILSLVIVAAVFSACKKNENTNTESNLDKNSSSYGFETDENGNEVPVLYEDGKAYVLDDQGNKTGEIIKNPKNMPLSSTSQSSNNSDGDDGETPEKTPDRDNVDNNTGSADSTTSNELTTLPVNKDTVPSTSDSGKSVEFSDADVKTITNMLEVPYLYTASYENSQKIPTEIATHVVCWMLEREQLNTNTFAGNTVIIDLFNYFARTVVEFRVNCNSYTGDGTENAAPISYNSTNDVFTITADKYEEATHIVNITKIEDLGNNNYYKVIADVKGKNKSCKAKKVVAVIQKNKLDTSLGFSIKALKWS